MSMTHRQRVLTAFNHQEPDRVPLDMMGNATMLLDQTYLRLRDYLGLSPIPPIRSGTNANYYDERILEYLDIDFRRIFLKEKTSDKACTCEDGTYTDAWGIRYKKEGLFLNIVENPLRNAKTVRDIENYNWPEAEEMFTAGGLADQAKHAYEETAYALVARNPITAGFLDRTQQLMGNSQALMASALNPEVFECIISRLLDIYKDIYALFLDAVGQYVQMVEVGDDLGTQQSLLLSPEAYRKLIKPAQKELYRLIREKAPRAALFYHSCGALFPIIPDLIEVGVNVLNPVQVSAGGMVPQNLKDCYGKDITFHGAVQKMECPLDELVAEVKERIDVFGPKGGYVFASCNHMIDVKSENIIAMFETAREYGRYK